MENGQRPTFVTFVLDETGSMGSIKEDTIGGFNDYVKGLQKSGLPFEFTLLKWDSNHQTTVCSGVPIDQVPLLNDDNYKPGYSTPLIDVAYKAIKATEEKVSGRDLSVQIVIQTDGEENASVEHTNDELNLLVKEKTDAGWLITFIGAGIDAFDQARKWGITKGQTMSYGRGATGQAMHSNVGHTTRYASSGGQDKSGFTTAERTSVGEDELSEASPLNQPPDPDPPEPDKPEPLVNVEL